MTINSLMFLLVAAATECGDRAAIVLHNPTRCGAPAVVAVPTGRIAAPGLVDWGRCD
jgi:hypothetical protein